MFKSEKILRHHLILSITWALVILILSGMPGSKIPHFRIPGIDKVVHFTMYFIFSFLLMNSFHRQQKIILKSFYIIIIVLTISASYGQLNEILQEYLFSGRSAEWRDEMANILGGIIGIALYRRLS